MSTWWKMGMPHLYRRRSSLATRVTTRFRNSSEGWKSRPQARRVFLVGCGGSGWGGSPKTCSGILQRSFLCPIWCYAQSCFCFEGGFGIQSSYSRPFILMSFSRLTVIWLINWTVFQCERCSWSLDVTLMLLLALVSCHGCNKRIWIQKWLCCRTVNVQYHLTRQLENWFSWESSRHFRVGSFRMLLDKR